LELYPHCIYLGVDPQYLCIYILPGRTGYFLSSSFTLAVTNAYLKGYAVVPLLLGVMYRVLEGVATADVAFEVEAGSLEEVFVEAARALTSVMVDPSKVRASIRQEVELEAPGLDVLLFDWLSEIVYLKDAENLVFSDYQVKIHPGFKLEGVLEGEEIDRERHELGCDVKAVTYHLFKLEKRDKGWYVRVVLDI